MPELIALHYQGRGWRKINYLQKLKKLSREVNMIAPDKIDEFPQTEEARLEAVTTLARFWKKKFPGFEIRTSVPLKDIVPEPAEPEMRQVWLEESFDVVALAGTRIALFQILREDLDQTQRITEAIAKIVRKHEESF